MTKMMILMRRMMMATTMIKMIMITMPSTSRVPQLTCIWMSLPGASGLGKLTTKYIRHSHHYLVKEGGGIEDEDNDDDKNDDLDDNDNDDDHYAKYPHPPQPPASPAYGITMPKRQ